MQRCRVTERYKRAMEGGKCPAIVDTRQPQSCHDHCAGSPKSDGCDPEKGNCEGCVALSKIIWQCLNNNEKTRMGPPPIDKVRLTQPPVQNRDEKSKTYHT